MRTFLEDLQNSSPERKKRWLVGLTIVIMLIVIIAWAQLLDVFVFTEEAAAEEVTVGFGESMMAGVSTFGEALFTGIKRLGSMFTTPREILIGT